MSEFWLTIDTNNYPNVHKTLIEYDVLEDDLITVTPSGFCKYPVYQLSERLIDMLETTN
ncbi:hypothetical protein [Mammaliicoccus sp. E-M21]|uniref:hypothetical protein n=1 Tax=Mammaliicoccus sp. E-M21 TaxID=2898681 RepID=UPI001EFB6A7C|nr:hypothetical protein [Mammaliicoccus sp. E-M21]